MLTEVFVTYVVPTNETQQAVHYHDLAMVAEVHLEAVEPSAASGEGMNLYTTVAQLLAVSGWQGMAANAVIQHEHLHSFGSLA